VINHIWYFSVGNDDNDNDTVYDIDQLYYNLEFIKQLTTIITIVMNKERKNKYKKEQIQYQCR